ncbi:MAG: acetate--CoA ligase [Thermoplasmata archaeon]|nr:acetate--CoA ligase [Thermoplasmata archaeon]
MSSPRETPNDPEVSEAQIAVHWKEEPRIDPPAEFVAQANVADVAVRGRFAIGRFPECFREYAELLDWATPWHTTLDTERAPFYRWFVGGTLNAAYNCVDRHLARHASKPAFIWVPEPEGEPSRVLTYRDLYEHVNAFAALLRDRAGVNAGDRVTIHLPMVPELPISMLACARLGAIHSVVFGGFSGDACGVRIADSGSRVLVTMDGSYRNGKWLDHRGTADVAVAAARREGQEVDHRLFWRRHPERPGAVAPPAAGRDLDVNAELRRRRGSLVPPVPMPAEAPLFLMYTSGTTGRPKGCQHSTGGYLAYAVGTSRIYQDLHPEDIYWCLADIGWITGHSYIVYGPLALATTSVLYEGVPTFPDPARTWRIAAKLGVTTLHTSPTTIRLLRKADPDGPRRFDLRFKHLTTVGEPIEPEVWRWYYETVGRKRAVIVDTWWQTETGGVLCSTIPGLDPMKPGSTGPAALGIFPSIVDDEGVEVPAGSGRAGNLCIRNPWPGMFQTIWGDPERFLATYFRKYNRAPHSRDWRDWPYFAGDGATQSADGYFRVLGRVDDVINVAGHRLGTKEIESACLSVPDVAEAAVVPVHDELKGRRPEVYLALKPGSADPGAVVLAVARAIENQIGKIARPRAIRVVPDMPKTRSGKIMRRVLSALSNAQDVGDITTLANPEAVAAIQAMIDVRGRASPARVPDPAGPSDTNQ